MSKITSNDNENKKKKRGFFSRAFKEDSGDDVLYEEENEATGDALNDLTEKNAFESAMDNSSKEKKFDPYAQSDIDTIEISISEVKTKGAKERFDDEVWIYPDFGSGKKAAKPKLSENGGAAAPGAVKDRETKAAELSQNSTENKIDSESFYDKIDRIRSSQTAGAGERAAERETVYDKSNVVLKGASSSENGASSDIVNEALKALSDSRAEEAEKEAAGLSRIESGEQAESPNVRSANDGFHFTAGRGRFKASAAAPFATAQNNDPENKDSDESEPSLEDVYKSKYLTPDEAEHEEEKYEDAVETLGDFSSYAEKNTDDEPIGSTDMNLRIAFGLEETEDEKRVMEKVKKLGDYHEANKRTGKTVKLDKPEFTDPIQAKGIAADYRKAAVSFNIKLIFAALFTILLIVYENISPITGLITGTEKQFSGALDPMVYPVVYIMVSLQILFVVCAFGFKELRLGVRKLFSGAPGVESLTALLVLASVAYSAFSAYSASVTTEPVMFNSAAAFAVTLMLFSARLNNKREMATFYIAGSKKGKYVIRKLLEDDVFDEEDLDYEDSSCEVMKVEKAKFIDSFFARLQTPDQMKTVFISSVMGICVAAAVLAGVYCFINSGSSKEAVTIGYLAILTLAPASAYVTFSYPFYRASAIAREYDSAIIGDASLEEYAGASVMAFDDNNIFPSFGVKVQNIRIYNNARIDRVLFYAASVFAKAGGPLSDIFGIATLDMEKSEDVKIFEADKGFLASKVNGVNIIFGSLESLKKRGLDVSDDIARDDVDFSDEMSIMYMAREGMLVAKIYIKYVMDGDIELILKQFQDSGAYMCVRTYDPNIDEDMIASKVKMKNIPLKVVRYRGEDEVGACSDRSDSGVVTNATPKSLLQVIPYCDAALRTKKDSLALGIVSIIISAAVLTLLYISGGIGQVNSLFVAAYQAAWLLPSILISKLFVR